ncbi:hypothetical protein LZ31DRAFT_555350 [Colletotrichum somersetense]|nr:hypothetical protein LZ31DRAFT_555350 [Colletotrichum somersetense]
MREERNGAHFWVVGVGKRIMHPRQCSLSGDDRARRLGKCECMQADADAESAAGGSNERVSNNSGLFFDPTVLSSLQSPCSRNVCAPGPSSTFSFFVACLLRAPPPSRVQPTRSSHPNPARVPSSPFHYVLFVGRFMTGVTPDITYCSDWPMELPRVDTFAEVPTYLGRYTHTHTHTHIPLGPLLTAFRF